MKIKADDYLQQAFSVADADFDIDTPYYCQVAYNKTVGGASGGTLTLTFGDQTASINLASASTGWQVLRIALGTGNWYKAFGGTAPVFKVAVTGLAGSYLLVDDLIVAPFTEFDNSWYCLVGGATQFRYEDTFTFTDTETGAVIQYWFWRLFDRYLPATTGGGITWADP